MIKIQLSTIINMKFAKLKAFLSGKKIETPIAEKGDGTVMLTAEQATATETLASELETAQENLTAANQKTTTMQSTIDTHVAAGKTIRTELGIAETATTEEVVTAIQGLKTEIETLGKQPGSLGKTVKKKEDEVETETTESADQFRTSYDAEADAELAAMGITTRKK